jgi:hypothetical protein
MSNRFKLNSQDLQNWFSVFVTTVIAAFVLYLSTVLSNLSGLTGVVTWKSFFSSFAFTPGMAVVTGTLIITNVVDLLQRYVKGQNGTSVSQTTN